MTGFATRRLLSIIPSSSSPTASRSLPSAPTVGWPSNPSRPSCRGDAMTLATRNSRYKIMRVSLLVSALILLAAPPVVRAARSKCDLVVNAEGIAENPEHSKSCTDGDSACDTGQSADGICQYHVSLCFKTAAEGACAREEIEGMSVTAAPGLEGLVGALTRLKANLTADSCTEPVNIQVKTRGKRLGRSVLKAQGPKKRERYTFVCRPSHQVGVSATVAKDIQKKIFD